MYVGDKFFGSMTHRHERNSHPCRVENLCFKYSFSFYVDPNPRTDAQHIIYNATLVFENFPLSDRDSTRQPRHENSAHQMERASLQFIARLSELQSLFDI